MPKNRKKLFFLTDINLKTYAQAKFTNQNPTIYQ